MKTRFLILLLLTLATGAQAWWNKEWTIRKKVTLDTGDTGVAIPGEIGQAAVLVRLHDGNFQFGGAKEDGGDIRFVSEDDKTVLPYQIEKYDSLMNEAFVWVKVPTVKAGGATSFWLYYGNAEAAGEKAKGLYDADTTLVYHFAEHGTAATDSTDLGNNAQDAGTPVDGAIIGAGLRALGKPLTTTGADSLAWNAGQALTWSSWVKAAALQPNAVIFSRRGGANAFVIGLDNGVPYVEVTDASGTRRSAAGEAIPVGTWKHLAVVADATNITLYVDGQAYGTLAATVPALTGPLEFGTFNGELDELQIARVARGVGAIKFASVNQGGSEAAQKLLVTGEDEGAESGGHSPMLEHLSLFGDIAKNMMFDGWVVIFCCGLMALTGWTVAVRKFLYLNKIEKGSKEFERQWQHVAADLTLLDHTDAESVKSLGGKADSVNQKRMRLSPLYHIYHIGSEEIRHRLQRGTGFAGLSARSIQAIRASLDAGLTREVHKMNGGLIFLTISIAGGPYVGLLGTVMGVMITFAVIAKTGQVEVNSIAPGIASALLATVAGLIVAIPALFMYSYLNSRIKDSISTIQLFINEFVTKMAEFYPAPAEQVPPASRYAPASEEVVTE